MLPLGEPLDKDRKSIRDSADQSRRIPETGAIRRGFELLDGQVTSLPSLQALQEAEHVLRELLSGGEGVMVDIHLYLDNRDVSEDISAAVFFLLDVSDALHCSPQLESLFEAAEHGDLRCVEVAMVQRLQLQYERSVQQELQRTRDALQMLITQAASMGHDANNLLTYVMGTFELLLKDWDSTDYSQLVPVLTALKKICSLSRGIVTLARSRPERTHVDVHQVIDEVLSLFQVKCQKQDITIRSLYEPGPFSVFMSPLHFEQILLNLVGNAIQALGNGGEIVLYTRLVNNVDQGEPRQWILLSVRDSGIGMDEETKSRIFERGFTTRAKDGGSGIGLAAVSDLVDHYGGSIYVKSTLGEGTTFSVYLPAILGSAAETSDTVHDRRMSGEELGQK